MMKILFYISILMSLGYAQLKVGIVPFGLGMGISGENKTALDVDLKLVYLSYKSTETGLGIAWVPVNYRYFLGDKHVSVINFETYWDILAFIQSEKLNVSDFEAMLGPFAYLNYAPDFDFNDYWLYYGIRYSLGLPLRHGLEVSFYVFNIECGNRIINNKNGFYLSVGIDMIFTPSFVLPALFHL